jgi:hypothetical protein
MCKGRGFYGIPGGRCTFCDGTGKVKWRSRPVAAAQPTLDERLKEHAAARVDAARAELAEALAEQAALGVDLPDGEQR